MGMQRGAIAFLDALGFKGIWETHNADTVITNLKDAAHRFDEFEGPEEKTNLSEFVTMPRHWYRFFADSVVVACSAVPKNKNPIQTERYLADGTALNRVCNSIAVLCADAATQNPPLVYRGAVSFGDFLIDEHFWIGPAIDEAAENERKPRAGLVWLCPSAYDVYNKVAQIQNDAGVMAEWAQGVATDSPLLLDYVVPLPNSENHVTHVVNPLARQPFDVEKLSVKMLSTFASNRPDIVCKREHTEHFLKAAVETAIQDPHRVRLAARYQGAARLD